MFVVNDDLARNCDRSKTSEHIGEKPCMTRSNSGKNKGILNYLDMYDKKWSEEDEMYVFILKDARNKRPSLSSPKPRKYQKRDTK